MEENQASDNETGHSSQSENEKPTETVIEAIHDELEKERPNCCKLAIYGVMLIVMVSIPLCGTMIPLLVTNKN